MALLLAWAAPAQATITTGPITFSGSNPGIINGIAFDDATYPWIALSKGTDYNNSNECPSCPAYMASPLSGTETTPSTGTIKVATGGDTFNLKGFKVYDWGGVNLAGVGGLHNTKLTVTPYWGGTAGTPIELPLTQQSALQTFTFAFYNVTRVDIASDQSFYFAITDLLVEVGTPPPAPTIASVAPASGPAASSTSVTISGTNFTGFLGSPTVTFGGTSATGVTVVNATTITATAPAHAAGSVAVAVTTPGGTATATNAFTYLPVPAITGVAPSSGSTAGGTSVALSGSGFTGATAVTFGGANATGVTVLNDGQISATTPAHAAGSVAVTVTTPGGTSSPATYTYADVPVAGAASHTAAYGGAATAVTLNISGTYTSVEVVTGPTKGTAVVNGLGIDYTPTAGQVGSDSFTYRASNASGTSNTATVSVTVNAPTIVLAPAAGALPAATVGTVYGGQTFSASGAAAPYSFAVTTGSVPGLNLAGNTLGGTPTTADTYNITVTATDLYGKTGTANYSLVVNAALPGAPTIGTATAGNQQAAVTFTAPAFTGGATLTYTVTSNPEGKTGTGATSPITVSNLTNGAAYTFTVTATNTAGTGAASGASNSVTPKGAQAITFNDPGAQNFGATPTLTASAPGGVVTFSSATPGVCTITDHGNSTGTLAFATTGTCTLHADQAGSAAYLPAPQVEQTFTVNAVVPGAPTIGTATAGDTQATVAFTAPAFTGGAAITGYTVTADPAHGSGSCSAPPATNCTVTGLTNGTAYTFTVKASNSVGAGAASAASNSVTPKAAQTITFNNPGAQNFGATPTLTASAPGGVVTFTSVTPGVCTITDHGNSTGTLAFATTGTCTLHADQAGSATYLPAPQVEQTFAVNAVVPGAPTIGTATAGNQQATVAFTAPAFTGGAAITGYTVTADPAHGSGSCSAPPATSCTVTGLTNGTAYTFTVKASNSAGAGAASAPSNSVTPKAAQTITFNNPGAQTMGTTPTLAASAPGGPITFSSATTGVCTITSGGTLAFLATGTCTIRADQAGSAAYLAAPQVEQSFTVNPAVTVPGAPTIGTATAGDQQATVAFTAPASTGGAPITSYTVTAQPGNLTGTGSASPIAVQNLTNGVAYTFTVTATNSVGTGAASAPSNAVTPKMGQTITFAQPASQRLDATPTLAATASSGLAVAFSADAATLAVCETTSGGTLAFHTAGACTIHADQAGDGQYLAAPRVSRTFNVQTAAPGAPTNVVATPGDTQARVAFTAPADAGTSPITGYTVTVQPGGATVTGTASPIVVPGLANGVAYTFTVTATNAAGTGAASSPSNSVTPKGVVQGTVPTPTSGTGTTGTATASTAALDPAQDPNCRLAGAQFAGEVPPGFTVSYGSFEFLATDCQHGVTISLTYPQALPQGVRFMKFGPPSFGAPDEWMDWTSKVQLSADRKTATYSVLDNGAGDSDPRVGLVADPIIPAGLNAPGPAAATAIPTLGEWALALLAALLGLLGWRQGRARAA